MDGEASLTALGAAEPMSTPKTKSRCSQTEVR